MRIAINGFGRIGKMIFRAAIEQHYNNIEIVAINDLQNLDTALHLLRYDSIHGRSNIQLEKISPQIFSANNKKIHYFSEKNPINLPWKELNIDLVMECTGLLKTYDKCNLHIQAGAKKVLLSCPGNDIEKTIIFGVNNEELKKDKDIIISCGSCTTNCIAPIIKILHSEFGIQCGSISTIHSYTNDQRLTDSEHKDLRRARAAGLNIIPTSTGAAKAITKIFPDLKNKLSSIAFRVPTPNVSLIDCNFYLKSKVNTSDTNNLIKKWSNKLPKILWYTEEKLVSSDFCHLSYSSIVDLSLTEVTQESVVHLVSWYDNEWGFSCRMLDNTLLMF